MTRITFNVPDSIDLKKLTEAFEMVGITPEKQDYDDDELIPLDAAMARAFPDMTPQEIIGGTLRVARQDANLTQKELAEMVGENNANISAMERGKRAISKAMAKKLGKALDVPYHTFL